MKPPYTIRLRRQSRVVLTSQGHAELDLLRPQY
jgi:hypothetical protein